MFSPPLPQFGDPTTVSPTVTGTETFSGCSGLGVTSGTATFTASSVDPPENCDSRFGNSGPGGNQSGTVVISWNTGQTTTATGTFPAFYQATAGLFDGYSMGEGLPLGFQGGPPGFCVTPLSTLTVTLDSPLEFVTSGGFDACAHPDPCKRQTVATATASAPGLDVTVAGTPAAGAGTVKLTIAPGSLPCPKVARATRPVAQLTETGFVRTDRLTITARLPITSTTSAEQVCFDSTAPFRSQTSPQTPKRGPALLLDCSKTGNVVPCVRSRAQIGSDLTLTFVVPGRDPRFSIVVTTGRQIWAVRAGIGKVGKAYRAQLGTTGGRQPFVWSVTSGKLPDGCTLDPGKGVISGTPRRRGSFTAVVKATDSERPPKSAKLTLPIKIT